MPVRAWRNNATKKPQAREPQKPAKKGLEDTCRELKQSVISEQLARKLAQKKEECRAQEEEQMAMIYGPNWKTQMPPWAYDRKLIREDPVAVEAEEEEEGSYDDVVVPMSRSGEHRLRKRAS